MILTDSWWFKSRAGSLFRGFEHIHFGHIVYPWISSTQIQYSFQKFEFDTYLQDLCQVNFPTQSFYWSRCPAEHHRLSQDLLEPTATFALRLNALLLGFLGWMGSQEMVGWVWPKMGEDVVPKWQVSLVHDDKLWDLVSLGISSTTWYLLTPQNSYHFGIDFWWNVCSQCHAPPFYRGFIWIVWIWEEFHSIES